MCRHIGYIGKAKDLYSILLKHKHSLIELAYKPKLMREATLNADGFGFAWKIEKEFRLYKNFLPIWNDLNVNDISKSISSTLVIGNVRSATITEDQGYFNTHPFKINNFCFSHNGYIKGSKSIIREKFLKNLNSKYINLINGNTDSELIFMLLIQLIETHKDIIKAIRNTVQIIKENFAASMLNFLIATFDHNGKKTLFATKFAIGLKSPSLYYLKHKNEFVIVASEKLNNEKWNNVKHNSLLIVTEKNIDIKKVL